MVRYVWVLLLPMIWAQPLLGTQDASDTDLDSLPRLADDQSMIDQFFKYRLESALDLKSKAIKLNERCEHYWDVSEDDRDEVYRKLLESKKTYNQLSVELGASIYQFECYERSNSPSARQVETAHNTSIKNLEDVMNSLDYLYRSLLWNKPEIKSYSSDQIMTKMNQMHINITNKFGELEFKFRLYHLKFIKRLSAIREQLRTEEKVDLMYNESNKGVIQNLIWIQILCSSSNSNDFDYSEANRSFEQIKQIFPEFSDYIAEEFEWMLYIVFKVIHWENP